MRVRKLRNLVPGVFLLLFIGALLHKLVRDILVGFPRESWQITEFLINYRGGFVGRGWMGEALLSLYEGWGLAPYPLIIALSTLALLGLAAWFTIVCVKRGHPVYMLPFVFFLGNPILNDFWVRKDCLSLLFCVAVLSLLVRKPRGFPSWPTWCSSSPCSTMRPSRCSCCRSRSCSSWPATGLVSASASWRCCGPAPHRCSSCCRPVQLRPRHGAPGDARGGTPDLGLVAAGRVSPPGSP